LKSRENQLRPDSYLLEFLRVYICFPDFVVWIELRPDKGIFEVIFVLQAKQNISIDDLIAPEVSNEALSANGDEKKYEDFGVHGQSRINLMLLSSELI
jgi:hypothetical protein